MGNTKRQNLQTSQGYIFHILQHFTTKRSNFTKFKMLFNVVVMHFTISKFFKILSITQSVYSITLSHVIRILDRKMMRGRPELPLKRCFNHGNGRFQLYRLNFDLGKKNEIHHYS